MGYKIQQNQIEDLVVDLRDIRDSITGLEEELTLLIGETGAAAILEVAATGDYIISLIQATGSNLDLDISTLRTEFEDFTGNGTAYDSDRLSGELSSYYLNVTNHFGTIPTGNLPNTSVTPGIYTNATVSVDQKGRVTGISSGAGGIGDMLKSTYDTNNNGIVDNSETLNGESGSYYRNAANLTGTVGTGQLGSADNRYVKLNGGGDISGIVTINSNGLSLYQDTGIYNGLSLNLHAGSLTGFPYSVGNINFVQFTGDDSILAVVIEGFSISNNESKLDFSISDTDGILRKAFSINGDRTCEVYGDIIAENFIGDGHLLTGINGANITGKIQSGIIPDTSVTPGTYTLSTVSIDSAGRITHAANGSGGAGDMEKSVYDTDNNGIVDNSEKLGGELPSYYIDASNLTGDINTGVLTGALENYIQFSGNSQNVIFDTFIFEQPQHFTNGLTSSGTIHSDGGVSLATSPVLGFLGPIDDPSYPTTVGQIDFVDGTSTGFITQNAQILVNAVDALEGQIIVKVSDSAGVLQEALRVEGGDGYTYFNSIVTAGGFSGDGSLLTGITVGSFDVGTTGADFNIAVAGSDYTFNLPSASTTARGVVTTSAQTFAGAKTFSQAGGASFVRIASLESTNAASAGSQVWSPALSFKGYGWKTNATAASQSVESAMYLVPVQGTTAPTANLYWGFDINGIGMTSKAMLSNNGYLKVGDGTSSDPGFGFLNDTDLGIYRYSNNTAGFTANTAVAAYWDPNGFHCGTAGINNTQFASHPSVNSKHIAVWRRRGTQTADAFNFQNDAGTQEASLAWVNASSAWCWRMTSGSASVPTYSFYGDTDNGMYKVTTDVLGFSTGGTERMRINSTGRVSFGTAADPTAVIHIKAGTATASTAPLKFTSGTNLTTAENGAMEYNGTNLFFTRTGAVREGVLTQSAVTTETVASDTTITVNINGTNYKILALA